MAIELLPLQQKSRKLDKAYENSTQILVDKLTIALNFTTEFLELLENDQSPIMDMESESVSTGSGWLSLLSICTYLHIHYFQNEKPAHLSADLQGSLSNFSQLTHGFGGKISLYGKVAKSLER
jgi:superoxide dismutase